LAQETQHFREANVAKIKIIIFSFLFSISLFANELTERKILHFTNSHNETYAELFGLFNSSNDVTSFRWKITSVSGDHETGNFSIEDLRSGSVFREGLPHKYLRIRSENFTSHKGGTIKMRIPKNVLLRRYSHLNLDYVRNGDEWEFSSKKYYAIEAVRVRVNKALGLIVGADSWRYPVARQR
jgi:hypothetical protein